MSTRTASSCPGSTSAPRSSRADRAKPPRSPRKAGMPGRHRSSSAQPRADRAARMARSSGVDRPTAAVTPRRAGRRSRARFTVQTAQSPGVRFPSTVRPGRAGSAEREISPVRARSSSSAQSPAGGRPSGPKTCRQVRPSRPSTKTAADRPSMATAPAHWTGQSRDSSRTSPPAARTPRRAAPARAGAPPTAVRPFRPRARPKFSRARSFAPSPPLSSRTASPPFP